MVKLSKVLKVLIDFNLLFVFYQLTYSTTRFAIYESVKNNVIGATADKPMPFYQKVLLAAVAGFTGGICGTPADMVNVRCTYLPSFRVRFSVSAYFFVSN